MSDKPGEKNAIPFPEADVQRRDYTAAVINESSRISAI